MEVILQGKWIILKIYLYVCFNPCFNGSHSSSWSPIFINLRFLVSILVLMEVILQAVFAVLLWPNAASFNPCFNGSHSSRELSDHLFGGYEKVSILVLMEVILQVTASLWIISMINSFNPCFNGSHSSRTIHMETSDNLKVFQSLF